VRQLKSNQSAGQVEEVWLKIARFREGRRVAYGVVEGVEVAEIRGSIFTRFRVTDTRHKLDEIKLLPPTDPMQMLCPNLNLLDRLEFDGRGLDALPLDPWHKGRNALIGHEDTIVIPKDSTGDVHYEGEVVAVIGKICRRVSPKEALRYILGYTCGNDVTERAWQKTDKTFWRAKGSDTFAPVGPWIETRIDPDDMDMVVRLNGEEVHRANTCHVAYNFSEVISYISQHVTLYPGDMVFSGSAGSTGAMKPEDVVEVDVRGVGVLRNFVRAEE
jgi:2-keto-4-pentenoate hydratase/2-oxohepta-3-ene-1,7-dioic acid hydratase in catechol pathway